MENKEGSKIQDLIRKYGINLESLKKEQLEIAKQLEIKDSIDFSLADKFGAIDNTFVQNKLLSCIIVCDRNFEIIDRAYVLEKVKFPYIPGFRNYRELIPMAMAFEKLREKPDIVFIPAQGILHPRLGLASHFSLVVDVPTIGVSEVVVDGEIHGGDVIRDCKKIGKVLLSKPGSRPMYISPGNKISVEKAYELSKSLINLPHKKPEPLHLAGRYTKQVRKELG